MINFPDFIQSYVRERYGCSIARLKHETSVAVVAVKQVPNPVSRRRRIINHCGNGYLSRT